MGRHIWQSHGVSGYVVFGPCPTLMGGRKGWSSYEFSRCCPWPGSCPTWPLGVAGRRLLFDKNPVSLSVS